MVTYQDLPPETLYDFTHKEYGTYDMSCIFNPDEKDICYPSIKKINILGIESKDIIFTSSEKIIIEQSCTYKKVIGFIDDKRMITVDKKYFEDNNERKYKYHYTTLNKEEINPKNKNVELVILIDGKCYEYRVLSIEK